MKQKLRFGSVRGLRRRLAGRLGVYDEKKNARRLIKNIKEKLYSYFARIGIDRKEQELFAGCVIVKNLAIVRKDDALSMDSILEELLSGSTYLRPVYSEILYRWRSGMEEKSFDVMKEKVPGKAASNLAQILSKMDKVNPAELVTAMNSFEEAFSGDRVTRAMRRAYVKSVVTTVCSMAVIFAILMDFVVVVVFMDMFDMLSGLG